jgi:hypothetical protein
MSEQDAQQSLVERKPAGTEVAILHPWYQRLRDSRTMVTSP